MPCSQTCLNPPGSNAQPRNGERFVENIQSSVAASREPIRSRISFSDIIPLSLEQGRLVKAEQGPVASAKNSSSASRPCYVEHDFRTSRQCHNTVDIEVCLWFCARKEPKWYDHPPLECLLLAGDKPLQPLSVGRISIKSVIQATCSECRNYCQSRRYADLVSRP